MNSKSQLKIMMLEQKGILSKMELKSFEIIFDSSARNLFDYFLFTMRL